MSKNINIKMPKNNPKLIFLKNTIFGIKYGIISMLVLIFLLGMATMGEKTIIIAAFILSFLGAVFIAIISSKTTKNQKPVVIFFSFLIASLIPLLPFFYNKTTAFYTSIFNGIVILFVAGIGETYYTKKNKLISGIKLVIMGIISIIIACGVGYLINLILK